MRVTEITNCHLTRVDTHEFLLSLSSTLLNLENESWSWGHLIFGVEYNAFCNIPIDCVAETVLTLPEKEKNNIPSVFFTHCTHMKKCTAR